MNLVRAGFRLFNAKLVVTAVQTLGVIYFARELGATQMGIFFLFQALLGILAVPADFGLRQSVEKRISEGESTSSYLSSVVLVKSIPVAVIGLLVLLFYPAVNSYVGTSVAVYLVVAIVLQELAKLSVSVLKGELRVGETAEMRVAKEVTWFVASVILVRRGLEAEGLILGVVIGFTVMTLWGWSKVSVSLGRPGVSYAKSLFAFGKFSVVSMIGGFFYSWMDVAIIGIFLTQAHVGAYEVAWRITVVTILLSSSIAATVFPQISKWDAADHQEKIEELLRDVLPPAMMLSIPAFFGILLFAREILGLVFGPEFTIATLALVVLGGEKIIQSMHIVLGHALQAIDRPDLAARAAVVSILLNLVFNVILILEFGIAGAAVATMGSFTVNALLHAHYLSKFVRIKFPFREVLGLVVAALGMTTVLGAVRFVTVIDELYELAGVVLFGAIVYAALVMLIPTTRSMVVDNARQLTAGDEQLAN